MDDYDDYDITPGRALAEGTKWGSVGMVFVLALVAIFALLQFVMWPLHWWYYNDSVNREAHITQQSYSNQVTMVQQVQQKVSDIAVETTEMSVPAYAGEVPGLRAQRAAEGNLACSDWSQLTPTFQKSSGEASWAQANCNGGILSISSPLYVKG